MDVGPVVRIPILPSSGEVPRIEAAKLVRPVRTELPPVAVGETPDASQLQAEPQRPPPSEGVDRRLIIDPTTQQVVFQAIDSDSGEVIRQVPEEVVLRLRVYARTMARTAEDDVPHADRIT